MLTWVRDSLTSRFIGCQASDTGDRLSRTVAVHRSKRTAFKISAQSVSEACRNGQASEPNAAHRVNSSTAASEFSGNQPTAFRALSICSRRSMGACGSTVPRAGLSRASVIESAKSGTARHNQASTVVASRRAGLTLLEILLVLAILAIVVGLAVPLLQGTFEGRKLKLAADIVRGEWARARGQAIRTGKEWAFVYEPGTGNYALQPYSPYEQPALSMTTSPETQGNFDYANGLLPRGVLFEQAQTLSDARAELLAEGGAGGGAAGASFILFYPDGTSQQTRLRVVNDRDWYVQLDLRALTGTASMTDIESLADSGGGR